MSFIAALLLDKTAFIQPPATLVGWLGWLGYLGAILYLGWRWRGYRRAWGLKGWLLFAALFVAELITSLFIGIRLPAGQGLPVPGLIAKPTGPALMVFSALPWVLSAGLLGSTSTLGLAGLSGLMLALFDTQNSFQPLNFALMGVLMGAAVNQRFRTPFFRALRQPIVAGLALSLLYPALFLAGTVLGLGEALPVILDFALTHLWVTVLAVAVTILLACAVAEVIAVGIPGIWGGRGDFLPSPAEKSLEARSFYFLGPFVAVMVVILTVLVWNIAIRSTRASVEDRMEEVATSAAENLPYAIEVGQSLILELASDVQTARAEGKSIPDILDQRRRFSSYFQQFFVLGEDSEVIASASGGEWRPSVQEQMGISLALRGVPFQFYAIGPVDSDLSAGLSFIAAINNPENSGEEVLIGRSDLASNPFASAIISSLNSIVDFGGEGMIIDEQRMILFHPNSNLIMTNYGGQILAESHIYLDTGSVGTRDLVFFQPIDGPAWGVLVSVPMQAIQRLALNIAAPMFLLLFFASIILLALLRVVLRLVTGSLKKLALEAANIAENQSQLAKPLKVERMDEVGQMRNAFERMRMSLNNHLNDQRRVLLHAEIERQRLASILASTPDPVLVTDAKSHLLLANPVAWQVFGNGSELELGLPIEKVISQEEIVSLMRAPVDNLQAEETIEEIELSDGKVYLAKATSVLAENKLMGRVCVLRDVTRFKEVDALKSDFVSTVSHDLRSPLTLIRGYATMLQMVGQINDKQSKYVGKILRGVDRMTLMVNNLLDLGRIEAGVGLKLELILITDVAQQVVSSLKFQADEKEIALEADYPAATLPVIEADPSLIQQALHNLVENAIKYTEPGGKVQITLRMKPHEAKILVEVKDTGLGISPADQIRLFEKFYRVPDRRASSQRGSGLGLAIVKSIVEAHHGRVWVESEYGHGSTFSFEIPVRQEEK